MRDERVYVAADVQPASEAAVDGGEEESAAIGIEVRDEPVSDGSDMVYVDGREGKPGGAASVGDRDPAVDQFAFQFCCDLVRADEISERQGCS
ncbi:hypothetical protein [Streptomyces sp. NPDC059816]|uniref:hypothetical protein n=1 Tax=Streptomyces sp. NPDC059816 TaxID=3346960 RepID=UPI003657614E